jgi:hypothetical protein
MNLTAPTQAPWHFGTPYAGQTLNWLPTDTQECFNRMIQDPEHVNYFRSQGWLKSNAITYKINSHGFRSPEFEGDDPCMISLGCSYTAGIGLPVESIWPVLVGNKLNLKTYNLAWGGTATDTCFRMAEYWIPQLKPRLVCMLTPPPARVEIAQDQHDIPVEVILPNHETGHGRQMDAYLMHWFLNDENARVNNVKNKLAIAEICRQNNVKFLVLDANVEMSKSRAEVGYARDYMHAGPVGHQMVADKFLQKYYDQ